MNKNLIRDIKEIIELSKNVKLELDNPKKIEKLISKILTLTKYNLSSVKQEYRLKKDYSKARSIRILELILEKAEEINREIKKSIFANKEKILELINSIINLEKQELFNLDKSEKELAVKEIKKADYILYRIIKKLNVNILNYINPINAKEEKQKFFYFLNKGVVYNPQFKYSKVPDFILKGFDERSVDAIRYLRSFNVDCSKGIGKIIEKKRYEIIYMINLIRSIGTQKVTKYSLKIYGKPSDKLFNLAVKKCLDYKNAQMEEKPYDAEYLKNYLEKKILELSKEKGLSSLKKWRVIVSEKTSSRAYVDFLKKIVVIKKEERFSEKDLKKLFIHEIFSHVVRAVRGEQAPYRILSVGTYGYNSTEEGIALYREKRLGLTPVKFAFLTPAYVVAARYALHMSFYQIFQKMRFYGFDDDSAYLISQRVKRGLSNTGKKGGFIKDHIYMLGIRQIEDYIAKGYDINDLMIGKISVNDVVYFRD